ncbi:unnamed protein product [Gordionus sp. m RMFG-2023]
MNSILILYIIGYCIQCFSSPISKRNDFPQKGDNVSNKRHDFMEPQRFISGRGVKSLSKRYAGVKKYNPYNQHPWNELNRDNILVPELNRKPHVYSLGDKSKNYYAEDQIDNNINPVYNDDPQLLLSWLILQDLLENKERNGRVNEKYYDRPNSKYHLRDYDKRNDDDDEDDSDSIYQSYPQPKYFPNLKDIRRVI